MVSDGFGGGAQSGTPALLVFSGLFYDTSNFRNIMCIQNNDCYLLRKRCGIRKTILYNITYIYIIIYYCTVNRSI